MLINKKLLISLVFLILNLSLNAEVADNDNDDKITAGDQAFQEGRLEDAYKLYEESWKKNSDINSLRGIVLMHLNAKDLDGLHQYIDVIIKNSSKDLILMRVAIGYSMHKNNELLFRRALSMVEEVHLTSDPELARGISRASIKFFARQ